MYLIILQISCVVIGICLFILYRMFSFFLSIFPFGSLYFWISLILIFQWKVMFPYTYIYTRTYKCYIHTLYTHTHTYIMCVCISFFCGGKKVFPLWVCFHGSCISILRFIAFPFRVLAFLLSSSNNAFEIGDNFNYLPQVIGVFYPSLGQVRDAKIKFLSSLKPESDEEFSEWKKLCSSLKVQTCFFNFI